MRIDDLDHLADAPNPILVMDLDLTDGWLNRRAQRLFPGRFGETLLPALRDSESLRLSLGAALAQRGPLPATVRLFGEVHRGSLRRLSEDRAAFEIAPPLASRFHALTQERQAAQRALRLEAARAEQLRNSNDRMRLATDDLVGVAAAPLTDLDALLQRLAAVDRREGLGLTADLSTATRRLTAAQDEIAALRALLLDGFLVDRAERIRLSALIAQARAAGSPQDRCRLSRITVDGLPVLAGNRLLAGRLVTRLLLLLAGEDAHDPATIAVTGEATGATVTVRLSARGRSDAAPVLPTADTAELIDHLSRLVGWTVAVDPPGRDMTALITAPLAMRTGLPAPALA